MDNANDKTPEVAPTGENKTVEITPELQAKLDQIQTNQETLLKSKKKTGPLIAVIVILLLVSAVCVAFTVLTKGKNENGGAGTTTTTAPTEELSELTDETAKAKIDERIDEVNLISYDQYSSNKKGDSTLSANFIFKKNGELFSNLGLSAKEKVFITAAVLQFRDENALEKATKADYKADAVQKFKDAITEADFVKYAKRISAEKFANRYKEIFGEEISHQTVNECGANAHYSADTGYYYFDFVGGCGGMDLRKIIIKKDGYKASDDAYYLDATVATVFDGQDDNGKDVCAIFNGYYDIDMDVWNFNVQDEKVAKVCKGGETPTEFGNDIKTGTKFRYTFDKEFHFKKIERL